MKDIVRLKMDFIKAGIPEDMINSAINEYAFEDLEGNSDSVVSAAAQDKYDLEMLKAIFRLGLKQYLVKVMKRADKDE